MSGKTLRESMQNYFSLDIILILYNTGNTGIKQGRE